MPSSLFAMQTALRVLSAFTEKREPEPGDLEELRRLAPGKSDLPADELACEVIQIAIQAGQKARADSA